MTDPSGHFFFFVTAIISSVVSAAVAVTSFAIAAISAGIGMAGAWLAAASTAQLVTAALLTYGAISSYQAGGFKGLVLFAATAFVTAGVGSYFGEAGNIFAGGIDTFTEVARAVTHGIVQGGFAELQGGDFGSSFLSGFTGSIAGSMISAKSGDKSFFGAKNEGGKYMARRTVAAAVVGGTTSELAGGKFANGAMSAAMVHLLNHEGAHLFSRKVAAHGHHSIIDVTLTESEVVEVNDMLTSSGFDPLPEGDTRIVFSAINDDGVLTGKINSRNDTFGSGTPKSKTIIEDQKLNLRRGVSKMKFIERAIVGTKNFNTYSVNYSNLAAFGINGVLGGYNSNSYAFGMMIHAGASLSQFKGINRYPGNNLFVPRKYFSHSQQ